jgi:hypothetical protein
MLQIQAKDRLDKVSSVLKKLKLRFPVAEISEKLGMDKGMTSAYLKGKKPMSANFYSSFMKEYGEGFEEEKIVTTFTSINNTESPSLDSLIRQNENLVMANKDLAHANMNLSANLLELTKRLNSNDSQERILNDHAKRSEVLELLAPIVKGSLGLEFPTDEAAALELDRRLSDIESRKKVISK